MNDSCTFTSMDATSLEEFVGKTVIVRTKQQHTSKGVVHTVDPVTKRYGDCSTLVMWACTHDNNYDVDNFCLFIEYLTISSSPQILLKNIILDQNTAHDC